MLYYLFKLRFLAPLHVGADTAGIGLEKSAMCCHADTLFSALCHEAIGVYGEPGLQRLVREAVEGRLLISDTMPYIGNELYLPKPALTFSREPDEGERPQSGSDNSLKKQLKKISHIPVSGFAQYVQFLKQGGDEIPFAVPDFGVGSTYPKVGLSYQPAPQPYHVGVFTFAEGAGLYFILGIEEEQQLAFYKSLIESLGYSGIGGKRSSGYGRFELAEDEIELDPEWPVYESDGRLSRWLRHESSIFMALSVILPAAGDWPVVSDPRSAYKLVQRRGFVQSSEYSERFLKRRPLVMFDSGSCFPGKLAGSLADVSNGGNHPVYRYGMGLMMGVTGL